ncbi:MAG TPA: hypothetical protein VIL55_02240 [Naasia sp.]|jgi:MFS family permease
MSTPDNRDGSVPVTPRTDHDSSAPTQAYSTSDRDAAGSVPVTPDQSLRQEVLEREKERFGGIKFGSAFFGWLTATGMAVLLTALVAAAGAAVGLSTGVDAQDAQDAATQDPQTIGIVGAIALAVILFLAYYSGGYVAGRMARFNGAKQGLAVWLWALIIAVLAAILGAVAGSQFNILANLNTFPRIPVNEGQLTLVGIITAVVVAIIALVAAILGGLAGMRFHRKVDRAGLGA